MFSQFKSIVGTAESASEHPLGKAIFKHASTMEGVKLSEPVEFQAAAGQGLQCIVNGKVVLVGNRKWMETNHISVPRSVDAQMKKLEEQVTIQHGWSLYSLVIGKNSNVVWMGR